MVGPRCLDIPVHKADRTRYRFIPVALGWIVRWRIMETAHLEYEERGTGPVVCLAHAGVYSSWFGPMFGEQSLDPFRVIRPIRPGYGHSPAPSEPASLLAHSRECGRLLEQLGAQGAYWVGHSSSCCMGLQLALDQPDLIAGMVLFEPAKPSGQMRAANAASYVAPALAAATTGDVAGGLRRMAPGSRRRRLPLGAPGDDRRRSSG